MSSELAAVDVCPSETALSVDGELMFAWATVFVVEEAFIVAAVPF